MRYDVVFIGARITVLVDLLSVIVNICFLLILCMGVSHIRKAIYRFLDSVIK